MLELDLPPLLRTAFPLLLLPSAHLNAEVASALQKGAIEACRLDVLREESFQPIVCLKESAVRDGKHCVQHGAVGVKQSELVLQNGGACFSALTLRFPRIPQRAQQSHHPVTAFDMEDVVVSATTAEQNRVGTGFLDTSNR